MIRTTKFWKRVRGTVSGVHHDQRGSISIVSVFALLMLVVLLGMVMNTSRQIDQKVRLQNAADAAGWSSGVVATRSMNSLAFCNHLLADTFALTAFMREARDRNAETFAPEILENWGRIAPFLASSNFPKFAELGRAIEEKIPYELNMVIAFANWASAASEMMLPVLETILAEEQIIRYQQTLTMMTPSLMQTAAQETVRRHGEAWPRQARLNCVVWRTIVDPVGGPSETVRRTLPVVDPNPQIIEGFEPSLLQTQHVEVARVQRRQLANRYLRDWNNETLQAFDRFGKMSQFSNLWRIFTCGQLRRLLEVEYPNSNLPFQLRMRAESPSDQNDYLEQDFMWVAVVYRDQIKDFVPGVFRNPSPFDRQATSQVMLFVPRRRLIRVLVGQDGYSNPGGMGIGGVPGDMIILPPDTDPPPPPPPSTDGPVWRVGRQGGGWHPDGWNLLTQNWNLQLVPTTARFMRQILSTPPTFQDGSTPTLPDWTALSPADYAAINHH